MRKAERLIIGKIQRGREIDREIVAQSILRERRTVPIGDLSTRRGDIEDVSPRQFLRLEGRDDRLLDRALESEIAGCCRRPSRRENAAAGAGC